LEEEIRRLLAASSVDVRFELDRVPSAMTLVAHRSETEWFVEDMGNEYLVSVDGSTVDDGVLGPADELLFKFLD